VLHKNKGSWSKVAAITVIMSLFCGFGYAVIANTFFGRVFFPSLAIPIQMPG
jgi:hypothetical protein